MPNPTLPAQGSTDWYAWASAIHSSSFGSCQTANNLSDVASAATARTNLGLATVASSGAYADLTGRPTLATVATTGSYNDLTNKPSGSDPAWVFRPENYGAHADAKIATDVSVNGTNTITSATIAASAAVGQWVMIDGGRGTSDTAAIGTITAISGNNITLDTTARSLPVNVTASSLNAIWGTDDTTAINNCVAAAKTYAEANNFYAKVAFNDKGYIVSGLTQSNDGNIMYNCSVPIPRPTNNNGRKLVIEFAGAGRVDHHDYWNSTVPSIAGTFIVSTQLGPRTVDGTYAYQSVFGAGTPQSAGNMAQALDTGHANPIFVNHKPIFRDMQVITPAYGNVTAFDFQYSTGAYSDGCSAYAFANMVYGNGVIILSQYHSGIWSGSQGCGMRLPLAGNNADVVVQTFDATGMATGMATPSEHVAIGTLKVFGAGTALLITGSNSGHGLVIQRVSAEAYQTGIQSSATGSGHCPVFIGMWNTETSAIADGGGAHDINDPNNTMTGEIHWANTVDGTHQFPIVNGGNNVRIVCESVNRGSQTAPSVPATTVALQNPFWRDAKVTLTGGTVTVVSIGGVTEATTTGGTFIVPTGASITLTYSAAPTWSWRLL